MHYDKLTHEHFARGQSHETFSKLQRGLSDQGRIRVSEAMKAAVTRITTKHELQYGMTPKHVDEALQYLHKDYEGRSDLLPKEREAIEQSFKAHFGIKEPKEI